MVVIVYAASVSLSLSGVQALPPLISFTPLAADQLLWNTYASISLPPGHQTVMVVRLVPFVPGKYCWVDVLVTKTSNGGGMFQRDSCDKPPTGEFRYIGSQRTDQMREFQKELESPRYRRYDRARFGTDRKPEQGHNITYMSREITLQVEASPEYSMNRLPTSVRSVLEQFWMMLSENVV